MWRPSNVLYVLAPVAVAVQITGVVDGRDRGGGAHPAPRSASVCRFHVVVPEKFVVGWCRH